MSVYSGDFLGFQLGDIHSSQLNITRVSSGNRYIENLTPAFTDITTQVPGKDGTYYWDTFYTQIPFTIDFAFDDLRDEDIRRLKQVFGFKGVKELIFDESLHKKYMVKCSAPPTLKYIGFTFNEIRVYKGEGSVNLIAYYPYALSTQKLIFYTASSQELNNIGDLATPIKLYYNINNNNSNINLSLTTNSKSTGTLNIAGIQKISTNDTYLCIDMRTHLIEGVNTAFKKNGTLYNKFITTGDFFELPVGKSTLTSNVSWNQLEFNYLYY